MTDVDPAYGRYSDFYLGSAHPRSKQQLRSAGTYDVRLLRIRQGSHALADPAIDELVLGFVLGGRTKCRWTWGDGWNESACRRAGDFGLSPIAADGLFEVDGPHELLLVGLPRRALIEVECDPDADHRDFGRLHDVYHRDRTTTDLCRRLWRIARTDDLAADEAVVDLVRRLRSLSSSGKRGEARSVRPLSPRVLEECLSRMQDDLGARHGLRTYAAVAGMTPSAFCRAFKASVGAPPAQHLMVLRVEAAKRMLTSPDVDIDLLALDLGFSHRAHFNRVFARVTGQSPTDYRANRFGSPAHSK